MNYAEALRYLDKFTNLEGGRKDRFKDGAGSNLPIAGQVDGLSLDVISQIMDGLGSPQHSYRVLHITGTNGKGSVAVAASELLRSLGLSVGLYTSPDLAKVNERIRWDGLEIDDDEFARIASIVAPVVEFLDVTPSRFELLCAMAFTWFAERAVDVAVVEVGLLGRYDATNVADADVAVITNVGKDHTDGVGDWRRTVLEEKAGIIKPGSHVVIGPGLSDLRSVIDSSVEAEEVSGASWEFGEEYNLVANQLAVGGRALSIKTPFSSYEQVFIPIHGSHQGVNMTCAVAAVEALLDRGIDEDIVREALGGLVLGGRFEVVAVEPTVILDGAHNPQGAEVARQTLDEEFAKLGSWILVVGMLDNKDPREMLKAFGAASFDAVICTEPRWSRALPTDQLADAAKALGIDAERVPDPLEALRRAQAVAASDDLVLVAGSLYLIGDLRAQIYGV